MSKVLTKKIILMLILVFMFNTNFTTSSIIMNNSKKLIENKIKSNDLISIGNNEEIINYNQKNELKRIIKLYDSKKEINHNLNINQYQKKYENNKSNFKFVENEFIFKINSTKILGNNIQDEIFKNTDYIQEKITNEIIRIDSIDNEQTNMYKCKISGISELSKIINCFKNHPDVEYAELNYIYECSTIPNDPYFDQQWGLNQLNNCDINAPEAWNIEKGSSDIIIAIIDTGIDYTHPDLINNIWYNEDEIVNNGLDDDKNGYIDDIRGWDFRNNDNDSFDDHFHGTHCAGIAGAMTNNNIGIAGVSWNCSLMALKGFNEYGSGTLLDIIDAIYYAADNGADIISMSWGSSVESEAMKDALNYAYNQGVFLVAAAGNSYSYEKYYPSSYENVISVAAADKNNNLAPFSNYGFYVDVIAPGVDILSTVPNNKYERHSGTSMACPFIAGLVGLLISKNHNLTNEMISSIIRSGIKKMNNSKFSGFGLIDANDSITRKPAIAHLKHFNEWDNGRDSININGVAWGSEFQNYTISYCKWNNFMLDNWTIINKSSISSNDLLATWNTDKVPDSFYILKLHVNCTNNSFEDVALIIVNNEFNTYIVDDEQETNPDFSSLSDAILNSGRADKIYIKSGNYESRLYHFSIDKELTIEGNSSESVIIYDEMRISADNVKISKLNFQGFFTSASFIDSDNLEIVNNVFNDDIEFYLCNNCTFYKNKCNFSFLGILLYLSSNNVIHSNLINSSYLGIYSIKSNSNIFYNNSIQAEYGIELNKSGNNTIDYNLFHKCNILIRSPNISYFYNKITSNNLVDNESICYLVNESNKIINSNKGEIILVNCKNIIIDSLSFSHQTVSIHLVNCSNCIIKDNTIYNNIYGILSLFSTNNNYFENNKIEKSRYGIYCYKSKIDLFINNEFIKNYVGIYQYKSTNDIKINTFNKNNYGIYLSHSKKSNLFNNMFHEDIESIFFYNSTHNKLRKNNFHNSMLEFYNAKEIKINNVINDIDTSNTVNNKPIYNLINESDLTLPSDMGQLILINCSNCTTNNIINQSNNELSIKIILSNNITISNLSCYNILLINSKFCNFFYNIFKNITTEYGIIIVSCHDINIYNNNIFCENAKYAIKLDFCNTIHIESNEIGKGHSENNYNYYGIFIYKSSSIFIINNSLEDTNGFKKSLGNDWTLFVPAFCIGAIWDEDNKNIEIKSNKFNNTTGVGCVRLKGSNNIVSKNNFTQHNNSQYGLIDLYGNDNLIINNTIDCVYNSSYGIYIDGSFNNITNNLVNSINEGIRLNENNNIITYNLISNCNKGIYLSNSNNNIIKKNDVMKNDKGIYLKNSNNNNLVKNKINRNIDGFLIKDSEQNKIFHNHFINNIDNNAKEIKNTPDDDIPNRWDNGYPSGGNYWSDYRGKDQDKDGIGDISYKITGGFSVDRFPLGFFDNIKPTLIIHSPQKHALYINNNKIFSYVLFKSIIIGDITISFDISDNETGIEKVNLLIDNKIVYSGYLSGAYNYIWEKSTILILKHNHKIEISVFDKAGNEKTERINVIKYF